MPKILIESKYIICNKSERKPIGLKHSKKENFFYSMRMTRFRNGNSEELSYSSRRFFHLNRFMPREIFEVGGRATDGCMSTSTNVTKPFFPRPFAFFHIFPIIPTF